MATKYHRYTDEQRAWLAQHRPAMLLADLATAFNARFGTDRKPSHLQHVCAEMGVTAAKLISKGQAPWNKGKKTGLKSASQFKPGQKPYNTMPVGSVRRNNKGFLEYKYAEGTGKFKKLHVMIYEKHVGPVGKNDVVLFIDGDKNNLDPANLACVSRREYAILNIQHKFGPHNPPEINAALVALVKLDWAAKQASA